MRALFPKIVEMENLKQFEWFVLRKALGRPRRFSQAFIKKEQCILQQQRDLVRLLQQGIQPKDVEGIEVGQNVPLPLSIGRTLTTMAASQRFSQPPPTTKAAISTFGQPPALTAGAINLVLREVSLATMHTA